MWRDEEFADTKRENRERIKSGLEPNSLIDVLSIVEHPAFQSFYDELMSEGLAGTTSEESDATSSCVFQAIWTVIPGQSGHTFHVKLDSRSVATRG
jgi:hypothetical protein